MAQRRITTIPLFKSTQVGAGSAGGTSTSDPIDLRDISRTGDFSLSYSIAGAGGAATAGTSVFQYLGASVFDGTYTTAGTFGSAGASPSSGIVSFSPVTVPFMKIQCVSGTSAPLLLTAELHVR